MSKCRIYIEATDEDTATGQVVISATGSGRGLVVAVADALVCMIEQTKAEGPETSRLAFQAVEFALDRREHAKIQGIRQVLEP